MSPRTFHANETRISAGVRKRDDVIMFYTKQSQTGNAEKLKGMNR